MHFLIQELQDLINSKRAFSENFNPLKYLESIDGLFDID
jgi:hypothetical protein